MKVVIWCKGCSKKYVIICDEFVLKESRLYLYHGLYRPIFDFNLDDVISFFVQEK